MDENRNAARCPYCGLQSPAENLLCIYCGKSLNLKTGFGRGRLFVLAAAGLLGAFIIWLLR